MKNMLLAALSAVSFSVNAEVIERTLKLGGEAIVAPSGFVPLKKKLKEQTDLQDLKDYQIESVTAFAGGRNGAILKLVVGDEVVASMQKKQGTFVRRAAKLEGMGGRFYADVNRIELSAAETQSQGKWQLQIEQPAGRPNANTLHLFRVIVRMTLKQEVGFGQKCHPQHDPANDCMDLFVNNHQTIKFNCEVDTAVQNGWRNKKCKSGGAFFRVIDRGVQSVGKKCSGAVRVCFKRQPQKCHENHDPESDCMNLFVNNFERVHFECPVATAAHFGWRNKKCKSGGAFFRVIDHGIESVGKKCSGNVRVCFDRGGY